MSLQDDLKGKTLALISQQMNNWVVEIQRHVGRHQESLVRALDELQETVARYDEKIDEAEIGRAMAEVVADQPPGLRAFNIASGVVHTIADMASELASAMAGPAPARTGQYRAGDVRHITASPKRAEAELGFVAMMPFADGIREFATAALRS